MKERYHVTGMSCSACSSHVEKAVNKLENVEKASVNLLTETMDVTYDETKITSAEIIDAVVKAGYGASVMTEGSVAGAGGQSTSGNAGSTGKSTADGKQELQQKLDADARAMKWRLGISIGFLIPLMYVSMHHMLKEWFGIPVPAFIVNTMHGNANAMNFALTQFLLLLPILYVNRKFFSVGFKTLAHRSPNMDSLIALGSGAALVYGIFAMYRISYGLGYGDMAVVEHYAHDLYFESSGTILTLITVGKMLEARSKGKTTDALKSLMKLAPKTATVIRNGEELNVSIEQVKKGDVFVVRPGENIPVDGIVIEGTSAVNEAALTGESIPVDKKRGDAVSAATLNQSGFIRCEATRVGEDTTLSQIIQMVSDAAATKAPIAKVADRVSGVFVPTVITIAVITMVVWLLAGQSIGFALARGISVLVISCPCALGLATPVAIMVGNGMGAKNGIMFKTAVSLEETGKTQIVALDKTGTITSGEPRVTDLFPAEKISEEELVRTAYVLEKKSEHPLARAVLEYAKEKGVESKEEAEDFQAIAGNGLSGRLGEAWLYGGNLKYIRSKSEIPDAAEQQAQKFAQEGKTPLFFVKNEKLIGIIAVADVIKEDSPQAVKELQNMGIRVVMLTGDNERTAKAIGEQAGVDEVIAGVLPEGKEAVIRSLKKKGKVAMVGDGINDAPALTRADIGIAIGAGTDIAIDAADVVLMKSRLSDVPAAIRMSRATLRNIHENLFWAFFYNVIGIPLAAGVWIPLFEWQLNPMFGAAAMSLSSFCVVTNALRLNLFKMHDASKDRKRKMKKIETAENTVSDIVLADKNESENKEETKMTKTMKIEGMMCGHCEAAVKKALEALEQVDTAEVSHEAGTAVVTLNSEISNEVLKKTVEDKDYTVTAIED